jgi:hypothetical protein
MSIDYINSKTTLPYWIFLVRISLISASRAPINIFLRKIVEVMIFFEMCITTTKLFFVNFFFVIFFILVQQISCINKKYVFEK